MYGTTKGPENQSNPEKYLTSNYSTEKGNQNSMVLEKKQTHRSMRHN